MDCGKKYEIDANAYLRMVSVGSTETRRYSICVCVYASKLPLYQVQVLTICRTTYGVSGTVYYDTVSKLNMDVYSFKL